jgi:demethylmenaquinone methyltransferase/2-methoxy-6-polyprenyl-1,4-benzoquinol methylase
VTPPPKDPGPRKDRARIRRLFDGIARRYDLLNHLLSAGIDRRWRRRAARRIAADEPATVLDVATGTGDLALAALAAGRDDAEITGVDLAGAMLRIARRKAGRAGAGGRLRFIQGDAGRLPFPEASFEAVSTAFGVRNFEDLHRGLAELRRVVKPGGRVVILEFSRPRLRPFAPLYAAYFRHVLPRLGGWISGCREAYAYLPDSVAAFPEGRDFLDRLEAAGFEAARACPLTFGIATIYEGIRPESAKPPREPRVT